MALREILTEPNKILRERSLPVDKVDKDLQKTMDDMLPSYESLITIRGRRPNQSKSKVTLGHLRSA